MGNADINQSLRKNHGRKLDELRPCYTDRFDVYIKLGLMDSSRFRAETGRRFSAWGLAPNEHLPLLELATALRPKSAAMVAARAVSAGYVAAASFGAPAPRLIGDLRRFGLWQHLTREEQALLREPDPSSESLAFNGWLVESVQFMAWSLGLCALDHFEQCSDSLVGLFPQPGTDPAEFVSQATLRPLEQLLQEADTLYMLHWRAVENTLANLPDPRIVLPRVSFRRHAADWVIGVAESWENISLDT